MVNDLCMSVCSINICGRWPWFTFISGLNSEMDDLPISLPIMSSVMVNFSSLTV